MKSPVLSVAAFFLSTGVALSQTTVQSCDRSVSFDAPPMRVTAPDTPVPFSPPLEEAFLPGAEDLLAAARQLAAY